MANQIKGSILIVMVDTNIQLSSTLIVSADGYENKKNFKISGKKGIPIN